jgi:hypothetical protein
MLYILAWHNWLYTLKCICGNCEVYARFWPENFKLRDHVRGTDAGGSLVLGWVLEKCGMKMWNGFRFIVTAIKNSRIP